MARPREFDEPTVIAAARDVFWAFGYSGSSIDMLGQATSLGRGSLYGAFGGKRKLFGAVLQQYCTDAVEAAHRVLDGPDEGALDRLRRYMLARATVAEGTPERGCLLAKSVAELAERDGDVAALARTTYATLELILLTTVKAAQRYGALRAEADAKVLAGTLLALQRGFEALGKTGTPVPAPAVIDSVLEPYKQPAS